MRRKNRTLRGVRFIVDRVNSVTDFFLFLLTELFSNSIGCRPIYQRRLLFFLDCYLSHLAFLYVISIHPPPHIPSIFYHAKQSKFVIPKSVAWEAVVEVE